MKKKRNQMLMACAMSVVLMGTVGCKLEPKNMEKQVQVTQNADNVTVSAQTTSEEAVEPNTASNKVKESITGYEGFDFVDENITKEEAVAKGYYVRENCECISGQEKWDRFVEDANSGKDSFLRMVNFYEEMPGAYFSDIYYENGFYHLISSDALEREKEEYQYLLVLSGKMPGSDITSSFTVLTDDKDLTFDDVFKSMISSDMSVIEKISRYQLVF